jgi:hypothetical protein
MSEDNSVKIFFRFYSDILEEETTETLLAEIENKEYDYYKLSSIPFYVPKIAPGDVVWAEYNESEGMLTFRKTVQHSGNSTIHAIVLDDEYDINAVCKIFDDMGCRSEKLNQNYFALEIPANIDYIPIKRKLDELEKEGILDYAESCLSEKHEYKNISFGS